MGFGGISLWQLLIVLLIAVLIFGTKKLRNIGTDLGGAVKGFRKAMSEGDGEETRKLGAKQDQDADFDEERTQKTRDSR